MKDNMKVIVVKLKSAEDIVCPKSSFMEDDKGVLRLVMAWRLDNTDFQNGGYRVDADLNPVWSYMGKKVYDAPKPKKLRHVSVKDYVLYYEDEILPLVE